MFEKHKFGVVWSALSTDLRQATLRARTAGFAGLQLEARCAAVDLTTLSQSGRREVRHLLSANDQELVSLRTDLGIKGLAPGADVDQVLARLSAVMETARGLSPERALVCVDLGLIPEPAVEAPPPAPITPAQAGVILIPQFDQRTQPAEPARAADLPFEAQLDTALAEIGAAADRFGTTVAFRSELGSLGALARALSAARCPWFGVDLDPVSILRDRWDMDQVFSRLGPLVRHVRARDAQAGHDRRTRPAAIGEGSTRWDQLLALLDEGGYHGWLTIDPQDLPDRFAGAGTGLSFLRRGF